MPNQLANGFRRRVITTFVLIASTIPAASMGAGDELVGSAWLADDIGGGGVVDRVQSTLEFTGPGQVGGLAGCNRYFGPVTVEDDRISFGNLAATRKMCAEAPMDQEQRFFQALAAATRLVLSQEGQVLELYAGDDRLVLRFSRLVEK